MKLGRPITFPAGYLADLQTSNAAIYSAVEILAQGSPLYLLNVLAGIAKLAPVQRIVSIAGAQGGRARDVLPNGERRGGPEKAATIRRFGLRVLLWEERPTMYMPLEHTRVWLAAFDGARIVEDA
jgi:hypothetical protein